MTGALQFEIAAILSFLISGVIINFISSLKVRILVTSLLFVTFFVLFLFLIPLSIQFYVPIFGAILSTGIIAIAAFISIRGFDSSFVSRLMMMGKAPNKIFMHNISIFINILSILAPVFLLIRFFQTSSNSDLVLAIIGFISWGVVLYATKRFANYYAYDIFASILSATYIVVIIFFFMYITTSLVVIVFDLVFLVLGLSTMVQVLYSKRKTGKVSVIVPKTIRSPEDSNIIIIQDEEHQEKSRESPLPAESEYSMEQETTEVRSNYEGIVVVLLGLILSFHIILLQVLSSIVGYPGFFSFPFQFSFNEYNLTLFLIGSCLIIAIYIAFRLSLRIREYTTKTMSERAAFLKFLTLMDEKERKRLLNEIAKTVRDILVGGIMDVIEGERSRWQDSMRKGRKFMRRLFGADDE
ncbi:MAG: hypothetical protein LUQ65_10775 [Candidatus Helarchaeota archaeon]|nr:hypothetical protein [Candidatus Helarchaeota archaeon]